MIREIIQKNVFLEPYDQCAKIKNDIWNTVKTSVSANLHDEIVTTVWIPIEIMMFPTKDGLKISQNTKKT